MDKTIYRVYWTQAGTAFSEDSTLLNVALDATEFLRKARAAGHDISFITMVSENVDHVGKPGVDSIIDGKCPDGLDFLGRISRHGVFLKRGR